MANAGVSATANDGASVAGDAPVASGSSDSTCDDACPAANVAENGK